jgi:plasmid stabilization system protein ParE
MTLLGEMPYIGRERVLAGTRELVVPGLPYIVVYRVEIAEQGTVVTFGVDHGAQLRPGQEMRRERR